MRDVVKTLKRASDLFIMPSFSTGTARVMDLFGSVTQYNTASTAKEADAHATKRDWEVVGQDIKNAINEYESKLPSR